MDEGLDEFSTSGMVTVAVVNACEIHEDDARGTSGMSGEIIEKGFVGVGSVVSITVAERDLTSEEGFNFGVGGGEVEDPYEVLRVGIVHVGAAVQHLGDGMNLAGHASSEVSG